MKFTAGELMEGWTLAEQHQGINAIQLLLNELYGDDKEMHTCILSFLLGYSAAQTKITMEMVIPMVYNAYSLTEQLNGGE